MTAVQFKQDSCCFSIYLDKLLDLPLKNIKKLLFTMCSEPWNNEQAIFTTSEFLAATVPASKQVWEQVSAVFQREYVDVKYRYDLNRYKKASIKANNNRLYSDVRKAKAHYEKWVKIQTLWAEAQVKYYI